MLLIRQIITLVYKNILIALVRRPVTTVLRALLLPIVFGWFLSYARNFFIPPAVYGIGSTNPIRSLEDALNAIGSVRGDLVFVNNGHTGGEIESIITTIGGVATAAGKNVTVVEDEVELLTLCKNSLRGSSNCVAGVVFHSSPTEPKGAGLPYNYTLRFDGSLGTSLKVDRTNNDQQLYVLPLQHAIDQAIIQKNGTADAALLDDVQEYPFTDLSQAERAVRIRVRYMQALIDILGVAFFIGICGVQYQQVGAQATERELKMAQLLEVMMPNRRRWEPQVARLVSYHIAFTLIYLPGWILMAIILQLGVFAKTSFGIVIIFHLLAGLSLASFSLFGAAFFKKAQLSGITVILVSLILAIVAQVYHDTSTGVVAITSLLFPSMNYTYFIILMARFEAQDVGTSLIHSAPKNAWGLSGIVFWIFLIIQIIVYPILAVMVERALWGTTSGSRHLTPSDTGAAVELNGFSKHFEPSWLARKVWPKFGKKKKDTVFAVNDLSLSVRPGQITSLLGANGSGKSTTLDAIAGLSKLTSGSIALDFTHGLGFCPQQNVLWKDLTVYEHIDIFERLKGVDRMASKEDKQNLIRDCDLERKTSAQAGSLSGGQMRKLQLASMFTGDSKICLVDEASSGVDPLARRKIQDILLAERSRSNRSIIFTTHYLDEAEIADYIAIMSKGKLKLHGTAPEIKQSGQYMIHLYRTPDTTSIPQLEGIRRTELSDKTIYSVSDAAQTADLLSKLEAQGYTDYTVSGPTVEDAFMKVAEEMVPSIEKTYHVSGDNNEGDVSPEETSSVEEPEKELQLQSGSQIGPFRQGSVLFRKRFQVFRRNVFPNLVAFLIIPIAAALTMLFLKQFTRAGCTPTDRVTASDISSLTTEFENNLDLVVGPSADFNASTLALIVSTLDPGGNGAPGSGSSGTLLSNLTKSLHMVDTLAQFEDYIARNYHNVTPGGFFLGDGSDPPTVAYLGDGAMTYPIFIDNMLDTVLTGIPIATQYQAFDIPWEADQGNTLQYAVYFGLALAIYPAFFALYPTLERLRHVRGLHYSNGVRALPLWLAYIGFDFCFVFLGSSLAVIILVGSHSSIFYGMGVFWVVLLFYGVCATLFSYVVSLYARSQLGAFAIAAAYQAITALLYIIAYLSTLTYAATNQVDHLLEIVHFTLALIFPTASLFKALFISLNILSINCRGVGETVGSPGDITAYGGPILYLIVQSLLLFTFLVWWDSGNNFSALLNRKYRLPDGEEKRAMEPEVIEELERVTESTTDGLRVLHLSKAYGKNLAVDDASFGVKRGEVFGLLGPNGAGKSTTISVVRGDIKASNNGGDVFIENISLNKKRAVARQHLSACPQHDAMDRLTVVEHLQFYARVRGVKDVNENVEEVIRAVGLGNFKTRMGEALSGGNKRKLSLGIALMGNPTVVLLDEPSSGLDVAAKRVMWRTLEAVVPGRSIVLTTHSMEEADRLCNRAGIIAKRMLAVGTSDYLRKKHGDRYYVHLLLKSAPYTSAEEAEKVKAWILETFSGAETDAKAFHGQLRFSVPASERAIPESKLLSESSTNEDAISGSSSSGSGDAKAVRSGISALFSTLEQSKDAKGFEYYSVSQTTLDQVFLSIVGKHNVQEENAGLEEKPKKKGWLGKFKKA